MRVLVATLAAVLVAPVTSRAAPSLDDYKYFRALSIPLVEGRLFTDGDRLDTARVVLVNQRAVRDGFGGRSPIGRRIQWDGQVREIVGVVGDVRQHSLTEPPAVEVFSPATQLVRLTRYVAVRTESAPGTLVPALRAAVARIEAYLVRLGAS